MSQNAVKRLYLMQVGSMPEYEIPIVCYLVQTDDGKNILIDSGLPEIMPEGETEFENGQAVIEQLASIGLNPDDIDTVISTHYDIDHAGRHAAFTKRRRTMLFSLCIIWMRRATHVLLPIGSNGISQWSAFGWWTATQNCCRGWS